MKVSLDKCAGTLIGSGLTLLFLPDKWLLSWQTALFICLPLCVVTLLCYAFKLTKPLTPLSLIMLVILSLAHVHSPARLLLKQADNISTLPQKIHTDFTVEEVLNQQHFQAVVIRAKLADNLPEQRIYAQWKDPQTARIGERYHGDLRLRPLSSRLNFNGFDRQQWYFGKHISAWASVQSAVKIENVFSWRQNALHNAHTQTAALAQQGLLLALSFGERAWLDNETWQIYQKTNTAHLIAISGLHIGLAMLLGFGVVRLLQGLLPTRYITPWLPIVGGLLCALVYSLLAGMAIPTLRAIIALLILYAVQGLRLYWTSWRLLWRVVALLILLDPLMLLSTSFWLSVGAVTCLIIWYQYFPLSLLQWRQSSLADSPWRKVRWLFSLFHLQFGLLWLFTPIQLLFFNGLSLSGFFANVIAVPLYSVLLTPLVLFAVFTQGALYSWQIADNLAQKTTALLAYWQDDWLTVSLQQSLWATFLLTLAFLVALHWVYKAPKPIASPLELAKQARFKGFHLNPGRGLPSALRKNANVIGGGLMAFCLITLAYLYSTRPNWQLDTLDVGQGLATLIVKDGNGVLYDTGPSWNGGSMAKLEILPYLQREGITLDWLIISHDDNDHAGGVPDLLTAYPNLKVISPSEKNYSAKNDQKIDRTFCRRGEQWHWQGLDFAVLWPDNPVPRAENKDSCTILLSDGTHRILLTGDADLSVEYKILPKLGKIDVLQVGHHGSKTSTGEALVRQTEPKIALISSGRWNPWHFPNKDVIARLARQQAQIYNTAQTGQIRLRFYDNGLKIQTARAEFSPWYRRFIGLETK